MVRARDVVVCAALVVAASLACGEATTDELRVRAAFDMRCPQSKLRLVSLNSDTYGVEGCGRRATYVQACRGAYDSDCTWVLNSDEHRVRRDRDDDE